MAMPLRVPYGYQSDSCGEKTGDPTNRMVNQRGG
jgi:hypothetical protein